MLLARAGAGTVSSPAEIRSAVAAAGPGDTVCVADGTYDLRGELTITSSGKPGRPIVLKARRQGGAVLTGDSRFVVASASHVVLEGFDIQSDRGPAVELRGSHHVRVTRNVFHLKEKTRGSWVLITGSGGDRAVPSHGNRIDHNLFENKRHLGNFITIEGSRDGGSRVSQHDTIDQNHFRDIGPRVENVLEAIRVGSSDCSLSSAFTLLERNLFERCDGDPEYLSIKASDVTVRHNTFRECLGSLSLRHGNRNTVEGNFVFGNGRTGTFTDSTGKTWALGTGGVRFYGDSMVIVNNYFEGLTGKEWDATLAVTNGNAAYGDGQPLTKHFRIVDALIAFNTFVDNRTGIEIGYDGAGFQGNWWRLPPRGLRFVNNLVVGSSDTLIKIFDEPESADWRGNIAYAREKGVVARHAIPGVRVADPRLLREKGLFRLSPGSPAVDAALPVPVAFDIDGQPRLGRPDVGADELSEAPVTNIPLTPSDVGPGAR